jgi:RNA polymerase sigma-70 factor (ECF subfamily)
MTDHAAFLDATLPHLDVVWNVARRMAPDPASAEDLVQETYLRAFRSYQTKGAGEMRSWLVAICLNTARSELRRRRRRPQEEPGATLRLSAAASGDDVAAEALTALERQALGRALDELPEPQRTAIVLVDLAGLTAREAAVVVGAPRGTILARIHRGRRQLARLLEREGVRDDP